MREHRFKAWDKTHNEWYMGGNVFHLEYSGKYGDFYFDNDHPSNMRDVELIWVESTGLHDRHGKEIWEGDKLVQEGRTEVWVVQWNKPFGCFGLVYTGCKLQTIPFFESYLEMMEVIGDIFEGGE